MPETTLAGGIRAHLAVPPVGEGPWPGVVVLHELFGLNDDIRQHADRLAAAGYVALAPALFGSWRCLLATFRALNAGRGKAFDDIDAARRALAAREDCTGRVGVLGFCMGGGFALACAARGFDAAAPNYAPLPKDVDAALRGACPVVASYGAKDRLLPRGSAAKLEAALERSGVEHDLRIYEDAGHSFLNRHDLGPGGALLRVAGVGYDAPTAEDAWARILRFFSVRLQH